MKLKCTLSFAEPHKFQLRAYIYQARDVMAKDSEGVSGELGYLFERYTNYIKHPYAGAAESIFIERREERVLPNDNADNWLRMQLAVELCVGRSLLD